MGGILRTILPVLLLSLSAPASTTAAAPDWSEGFLVPPGGINNPYALPAEEFARNIQAGRIHAQEYPVEVTGLLPPYQPLKDFFDKETHDPLKALMRSLLRGFTSVGSFNDVLRWVGLHPYPLESDTGVYAVPYPRGIRPDSPMGFSVIERDGARGFTISCAECHSGRLFGKTVLGLTNRFPRANETFLHGKTLALLAEPNLFQAYNQTTTAEANLLRQMRQRVQAIGPKRPLQLGLDTSLAQVALSLARRHDDAYAEYSDFREVFPREEPLADAPADSKPAVWWNVKYKNRWLSDGSVISGNPIYTNLLWNEIGRGADLHELESWLNNNSQKIQELTSAVFASEAPRFTDFFPAGNFPLASAKNGEKIYLQRCARCHGIYEKGWNLPDAEKLPLTEQMRTTFVRYHEKTFTVDVGTDPNRRLGMKSLERLNELAISKNNGIRIQAQKGYVPPPLVGIWARWPYFHNNSVPSLCALLTKPESRPKKYYVGPADNPQRDFDEECNGYPAAAPESWKSAAFLFDTSRPGLSNTGHGEGIILKEGKELLTPTEKRELIRFLQTL